MRPTFGENLGLFFIAVVSVVLLTLGWREFWFLTDDAFSGRSASWRTNAKPLKTTSAASHRT